MFGRAHFIICLLITQAAFAQNWCTPGAEWWYQSSSNFADIRIHHIYYADTIFEGRTTQLVRREYEQGYNGQFNPPIDLSDERTSLSDGVLWGWSDLYGFWDTLFVFNDHSTRWNAAYYECPYPNHFQVIDTGHVVIDGVSLKYWEYRHDRNINGELYTYTDRFVDRLGVDPFRFPMQQCTIIEALWYVLRCYRDSDIQYHSEWFEANHGPACDFSTTISRSDVDPGLILFPNPGRDQFTLSNMKHGSLIRIYDATGRCVFTDRATSERMDVDASGFAPGIYHIRLEDGDQGLSWIKE